MKVGINNTFRHFTACGQGQYLIELLKALPLVDNTIQYVEVGPNLSHLDLLGRVRKSKKEAFWELVGASFEAFRRGLDIIHNPYWAAPLLPNFPKVVVTVHDVVPLLPGFEMYRMQFRSKAYYKLMSLTTKYATAIIADSKVAAGDIRKYLGVTPSKIHVVPLAPAAKYSQTIEDDSVEKFCASFGLQRPYILYVASGFDHRKNVIRLIEAYENALPRFSLSINLVITGDLRNAEYPASNEVRELLYHHGLDDRVRFTGFVSGDDMPSLYRGAHICVFPSLYEGGGLAMLEAMASGRALLVSSFGALPELAGDAAIFVDPTQLQAITDGLVQLVNDRRLCEELGSRASARSQEYTWEKTAKGVVEVYKEVVRKG